MIPCPFGCDTNGDAIADATCEPLVDYECTADTVREGYLGIDSGG